MEQDSEITEISAWICAAHSLTARKRFFMKCTWHSDAAFRSSHVSSGRLEVNISDAPRGTPLKLVPQQIVILTLVLFLTNDMMHP